MGHATYLAIDLATIAVPFIFSFHPRIGFIKAWRAFWPACSLVTLIFATWDAAFTSMGVWGFNERYLLGPRVAGLPIEELLFFICIPFSCVFTYFAIGRFRRADRWTPATGAVVIALLSLSGLAAITALERWYTASTSLLLFVLLVLALWKKPSWFGRALVTYAALLPMFFVVNGLLTGSWLDQSVVWYNDAENLGLRMGTIPIEDVFYGLSLILLNIALFERLRSRVRKAKEDL